MSEGNQGKNNMQCFNQCRYKDILILKSPLLNTLMQKHIEWQLRTEENTGNEKGDERDS